jgi:cytochrome c peroxidase
LGAQQVQADEFNCLSEYSDAQLEDCSELRFMRAGGEELLRAFKPPTLRNVADRAPYMHAGQITTLEEVLAHYNTAPAAPAGYSELESPHLSEQEISQLLSFLRTLDGPIAAASQWLAAP